MDAFFFFVTFAVVVALVSLFCTIAEFTHIRFKFNSTAIASITKKKKTTPKTKTQIRFK